MTTHTVRFVIALHDHQPVGNFDNVFAAAYDDSYAPWLDILQQYPAIRFSLHTSGPLLEWLIEHRPQYIDRLRALVQRGQVEILGGGFYEPILSMIPSRDRVGQIRGFTEFLNDLFDTQVRGMWMAERVWEQSLTSDIVEAGIEYTILDDFHFRQAGLADDALVGYFVTENQGNVLRVFPGSEPMRYMIPFHDVHEVIHQLRQIHERHQNAIVVFADDGEKFGTWPNTRKHVYDDGWLRRFLDALMEHRCWIETTTLAECVDTLPPVGQVYLPDGSYREMTEWVLPANRYPKYHSIRQRLEHDHLAAERESFLRAGYWRNFKVKYPETREMYARMMEVSSRIDRLIREDRQAIGDHRVHQARQSLYRGQCNCPYWHGAFGGLYLPHLRSAVYEHLLQAERVLNEFEFSGDPHLHLSTADFNFDGQQEVKLSSDQLSLYIAPHQGGVLYEIDVLDVHRNIGASLTRRPETYHEKIQHHTGHEYSHEAQSIHDRVICKEEGLDKHLVYDSYRRQNLIEHLLPASVVPDPSIPLRESSLASGAGRPFRSRTERSQQRVCVELSATIPTGSLESKLIKRIELPRESHALVVRYRWSFPESMPELRFAVEWNVAGLATGADDRYFASMEGDRWGRLGDELAIDQTRWIGLVDEWIGIDVGIGSSLAASIVTFPVSTVSQSEAGFERVHQQIAVIQHWLIPAGTRDWGVELTFAADTTRARARLEDFSVGPRAGRAAG